MANVITGGVGRSFAIFASAARTATPDTQEFELPAGTNYGHFIIDCTAVTATPSVVFTISGVDRLSGKVYTILASAAITGTGTTVLKVGPGLTAAANLVANDILPSVIRITATHGDADSITYSMGAHVA